MVDGSKIYPLKILTSSDSYMEAHIYALVRLVETKLSSAYKVCVRIT